VHLLARTRGELHPQRLRHGGDVVAEGELVYPENTGIDLVFE
jgi:hypothetical protein